MLIHADLADGPAVGLVDPHEHLHAAQRLVVRRHRLALADVVDASCMFVTILPSAALI